MTPKKIMLAEDDMDDQMLFYSFLSHRADIVLLPPVENGAVLLEALADMRNRCALPDAIVLDQNMPKRNGLQTLQLLKDSPRYRDIPVMLYSTHIDDRLIDACVRTGAVTVALKPDTREGYNKMIDAFLQLAR
jgi:CheY-like chemotaxis protein